MNKILTFTLLTNQLFLKNVIFVITQKFIDTYILFIFGTGVE